MDNNNNNNFGSSQFTPPYSSYSLFFTMIKRIRTNKHVDPFYKKEQTLLLLKPEVYRTSSMGRLISEFENYCDSSVFSIDFSMLIHHPKREIVEKYYSKHKDKPHYSIIVDNLVRGPVIVMIVSGINVINRIQDLIGEYSQKYNTTNLRSLYGTSFYSDGMDASENYESAEYEINLWFNYICNDIQNIVFDNSEKKL